MNEERNEQTLAYFYMNFVFKYAFSVWSPLATKEPLWSAESRTKILNEKDKLWIEDKLRTSSLVRNFSRKGVSVFSYNTLYKHRFNRYHYCYIVLLVIPNITSVLIIITYLNIIAPFILNVALDYVKWHKSKWSLT